MHMHVVEDREGTHGGPKKALDPLELEFHLVVSCLACMVRTEHRPLGTGKAESALQPYKAVLIKMV